MRPMLVPKATTLRLGAASPRAACNPFQPPTSHRPPANFQHPTPKRKSVIDPTWESAREAPWDLGGLYFAPWLTALTAESRRRGGPGWRPARWAPMGRADGSRGAATHACSPHHDACDRPRLVIRRARRARHPGRLLVLSASLPRCVVLTTRTASAAPRFVIAFDSCLSARSAPRALRVEKTSECRSTR